MPQENKRACLRLEQCKHYMKLLGIQESDLVSCSYSDLLTGDNK